jgi:C1A family cysteine protease
MNKIIILFLFLTCANLQEEAQNPDNTFALYQMFLHKYSKVYENPDELQHKYDAFVENYNKLQELLTSTQYDTDLDEQDRLQLDITNLFDMTDEDFHKTYLNFNVTDEEILAAQSPTEDSLAAEISENGRHLQNIPNSYDWRSKGVVTNVKHQGNCGACYAFAAAGNIESLYAIKYGSLLNLSEQQIVNCDSKQFGCNGGNIGTVYNYIIKSGGLGLEKHMPYSARKGQCKSIQTYAKIKGKKFAGSINEDYIQSFLIKYGPLAAAVNANLFKYYKGGVFRYSAELCSPYNLNHAIVIVGYGVTTTGVKYWIIKNTWGPYWGENGFMRIGRGVCGINRYIVTGIIE